MCDVGFRDTFAVDEGSVESDSDARKRADKGDSIEEETEADGTGLVDIEVAGANHERHFTSADAANRDRHSRGDAAEEEEKEVV